MENTTPEISRRIRENLTVTLIVSRSEPLRGSPGQLRSNSQVSGVAACMRYTLNRPAISSVPKSNSRVQTTPKRALFKSRRSFEVAPTTFLLIHGFQIQFTCFLSTLSDLLFPDHQESKTEHFSDRNLGL